MMKEYRSQTWLSVIVIVFCVMLTGSIQGYALSEDEPASIGRHVRSASRMLHPWMGDYVTIAVEVPLHVEDVTALLQQELAKEPEYAAKEIPAAATSFKSWMSYKAITSPGSTQYKLQQEAETDEQGFRRMEEAYMVAVGTYYTDRCGTQLRITLDNGTVFMAIVGDIKSDRHTDARNQHKNGNVIEFIVDEKAISSDCKRMGDMSYADGGYFDGMITSIEVEL